MTAAEQTRRSYDAVAERYAAEIGGELGGKPLDRALLDAFAELTAGGAIADVGCGPGHVAAYLAAKGRRVIGLDLSPQMCAVGRRGEALPFITADMRALPLGSRALAGIVCCYAVIHLDATGRAVAYSEIARALRDGGWALFSFHSSDVDVPTGGAKVLTEWWGEQVQLIFHFLDPEIETRALAAAGLELVARMDRRPDPDVEHASQRSYLLLQRAGRPRIPADGLE